MRALEIILAVILSATLIFALPSIVSVNHYSRCMSITANETVESFLAEIKAKEYVAVADYDAINRELMLMGYEGGLVLSAYSYEMDVEGNRYVYTVTWKEISESLMKDGKYYFTQGSYVVASADAYMGKASTFSRLFRSHKDFSVNVCIGGVS